MLFVVEKEVQEGHTSAATPTVPPPASQSEWRPNTGQSEWRPNTGQSDGDQEEEEVFRFVHLSL